jgi:hypothetical protein
MQLLRTYHAHIARALPCSSPFFLGLFANFMKFTRAHESETNDIHKRTCMDSNRHIRNTCKSWYTSFDPSMQLCITGVRASKGNFGSKCVEDISSRFGRYATQSSLRRHRRRHRHKHKHARAHKYIHIRTR